MGHAGPSRTFVKVFGRWQILKKKPQFLAIATSALADQNYLQNRNVYLAVPTSPLFT